MCVRIVRCRGAGGVTGCDCADCVGVIVCIMMCVAFQCLNIAVMLCLVC